MNSAIPFAVLLAASLLLAFSLGGRDERWAASITVLAAMLSPLAQSEQFIRPEFGIFAIDIFLLVMLLQLALSSDRYWPLFATAFHGNAILIHIGRLYFDGIVSEIYADLAVFWAFPIQLTIILGTLFEVKRSKA